MSAELARKTDADVTYLKAVPSLELPLSSSSEGCLLALLEPGFEFGFEVGREPSRDACLDFDFLDTVFPLSRTDRRRSLSGILLLLQRTVEAHVKGVVWCGGSREELQSLAADG
jgi:hypothetical protein